jgi:hypothetical protein
LLSFASFVYFLLIRLYFLVLYLKIVILFNMFYFRLVICKERKRAVYVCMYHSPVCLLQCHVCKTLLNLQCVVLLQRTWIYVGHVARLSYLCYGWVFSDQEWQSWAHINELKPAIYMDMSQALVIKWFFMFITTSHLKSLNAKMTYTDVNSAHGLGHVHVYSGFKLVNVSPTLIDFYELKTHGGNSRLVDFSFLFGGEYIWNLYLREMYYIVFYCNVMYAKRY